MAPENAASVKFSVYLAKKERELEDARGARKEPLQKLIARMYPISENAGTSKPCTNSSTNHGRKARRSSAKPKFQQKGAGVPWQRRTAHQTKRIGSARRRS